jgi:hypothetical protein
MTGFTMTVVTIIVVNVRVEVGQWFSFTTFCTGFHRINSSSKSEGK